MALVHRWDEPKSGALSPLARETSFELVAELLDRLEKSAVPYVVQAGTALSVLDGQTTEITEPEDWEARIWVPESYLDEATRMVDQLHDELRSERRNVDSSDSG